MCVKGGATDLENRKGKAERIDVLPRRVSGVIRLSGHEGVIFRCVDSCWRRVFFRYILYRGTVLGVFCFHPRY